MCMSKSLHASIVGETPGRALHIGKDGTLYVARGHRIYRSNDGGKSWQIHSFIRKGPWERAAAGIRLSARLFRTYVTAFRHLSDGTRIAVFRDGLYRAGPCEKEMKHVFKITRGSRPLNITIDDNNRILFGEYGDFPQGTEICIYISEDLGRSFHVAYTFAPNEIRHVHNVIYDCFDDVYWVTVGDFDRQPGIGVLSKDLSSIDWLGRGSQKVRAVGIIIEQNCLYYGTDSELEQNYIARMDKRSGQVTELKQIDGSSLFATRFGNVKLISTCVEPSRINRSRTSIIYASTDETSTCLRK